MTKLTAFFFLGWLVAAVAFGAPTPTPAPDDDAKFLPYKLEYNGEIRVCGELARKHGAWTHRGCPELAKFFFAKVRVSCKTTGESVDLECPGGETRVETVPR